MSSPGSLLLERPAYESVEIPEALVSPRPTSRPSAAKLRLTFRSALVLTTAAAIVLGGAGAAMASVPAHTMPAHVAAASTAPELTQDQLGFISGELGGAAEGQISDLMREQAVQEGRWSDQMVALPLAGLAIGAAAWCASGALGSVPTSALDDALNGGDDVDYVRNAVIGCLAGNIGGWAWKVLPGAAKKKAIEAVIAFVIKYYR